MSERKIKRIPKSEGDPKPHPLLFAFLNAKSAATEIARQIKEDCKEQTPKVVARFVEEFGQKV